MSTPTRAMLAVAALTLAGCGSLGAQDDASLPPELRLEGIRFRIYRGDALRAFGTAETASLRRDSTELRASGLQAVLPRGSRPVLITAPAGDGMLSTHVFAATGGVVVARGDDEARTERARFAPAATHPDGLVTGDDPVTVTGRGYRLTGKGFTLDPSAGTIVVGGGARLVAGLPAGSASGAPREARAGRVP